MINGGFYEEVISLKDFKQNNREITEFLINEDLSEPERINFIFKKGTIIQKESLLNNLPYIKNFETFNKAVTYVMENIEIWDQSLYLCFGQSLGKSIETLIAKGPNSITENFIRMSIHFFIKTIVNEEENISNEYIKHFYYLIEILKGYKIELSEEIIEDSTCIGSFGNPTLKRRICVYFCACLIRIIKPSTKFDALLNRFIMLSSESDVVIRLEISFQIRFIFKELNNEQIKNNFFKLIENYLTDSDNSIISEFIESLFMNIQRITDDELLESISSKLKIILEGATSTSTSTSEDNYIYIIKIVRSCINSLNEQEKPKNFKCISSILTNFLKKNFSFSEKEKRISSNLPLDFLITDFNKVTQTMKQLGDKLFISDLFVTITKIISDTKNTSDSTSCNRGLIILFYENLHNIVNSINKQVFNKHHLTQFFSQIENGDSQITRVIFKNFNEIMQSMKSKENEEFFFNFISKFNKFEEQFFKISDWRIQNEVLNALYNVIECFYKNFSSGEEFSSKLVNFLKKIIQLENYPTQCEALKLLSKEMRYNRNKVDIIKYTECEFLNSKSFYSKRLYLVFSLNCLKVFSSKYLKESNIFDNIIYLLNCVNYLIVGQIVCNLKFLYPLLLDEERIKYKIMNKLDELRKNLSTNKINDLQLKIEIKIFDEWYSQYIKEKENNFYKEIIAQDKIKFEDELRLNNRDYPDKKDELKKVSHSTLARHKKNYTNSNLPQVNIIPTINSNTNSANFNKTLVKKTSNLNITKFNESPNVPIVKKVELKKKTVVEDKKTYKDSLLRNSFVSSKESKQIKLTDQDLRKSGNFSLTPNSEMNEKSLQIKKNFNSLDRKDDLITFSNLRSITPKISNYQGLNIGGLNVPELSPLPVNNKGIKSNLLLNSSSTQNVKKQSAKK